MDQELEIYEVFYLYHPFHSAHSIQVSFVPNSCSPKCSEIPYWVPFPLKIYFLLCGKRNVAFWIDLDQVWFIIHSTTAFSTTLFIDLSSVVFVVVTLCYYLCYIGLIFFAFFSIFFNLLPCNQAVWRWLWTGGRLMNWSLIKTRQKVVLSR